MHTLFVLGTDGDGVMKQIALCKQPAVLRRSALSRIEKARARTLKMTIVIGKQFPNLDLAAAL